MAAYAKTVLANEVMKLSGFAAGRNLGLFCAAANLGKFVHHGVLSRSEVENALMGATRTNGYAAAKHGGEKKLATMMTASSGITGLPRYRRNAQWLQLCHDASVQDAPKASRR